METPADVRTLKHFIGGEWVNAENNATFEVLNPLDDSLYIYAAQGSGNDIRKVTLGWGSFFVSSKS